MRFYIGILIIFLISCRLSAEDHCAKVTYIANMGFMVDVDENKVVIDGLFGNEALDFCDMPDTAIFSDSYFRDIQLIITTHNHRDHFSSHIVDQFLVKNPRTYFLSTDQACTSLKYKSHIISINPNFQSQADTTIGKINIKTFNLPHSPYLVMDEKTGEQYNKHQNVQNLGVLIEINGIKIFHSGDSYPELENKLREYKLADENIDIAILDRMFLINPSGQKIVKELINPKHIIIGHINPQNKNLFMNFANQISDEYNSVHVFEKILDEKIYKF